MNSAGETKQTTGYSKLLDLAAADRISVDIIKGLLQRTNAHPDLLAFGQVNENLLKVIHVSEELWRRSQNLIEVQEWRSVLKWILLNRERLQAEIPGFEQTITKKHHPLDGKGLVNHSLYAALWNKHAKQAQQERFCLLQAHLLLAQLHLLGNPDGIVLASMTDIERLKRLSWIYPSARTTRWVSEGLPIQESYLDELPVELPPLEFARAVSRTPLRNQSLELFHRHKDLVSLFATLYIQQRDKDSTGRRSGGGGGGSRHVSGHIELTPQLFVDEVWLGDRDDPDHDWGQRLNIVVINSSKEDQRELLEADNDPTEDEEELVGLAEFNTKSGTVDPGNFIAAAWAQSSHQAMANQLLPWAYNVLSADEIQAFLDGLLQWCHAAVDIAEQQRRHELIAYALVMACTGSSVEQTKKIQVLSPENNNDTEFALLLLPEGRAWRLRALVPDYRAVENQRLSSQNVADKVERRREEYVVLPEVSGASDWVLSHYEQQQRNLRANDNDPIQSGSLTSVFRKRAKWYEKGLSEIFDSPIIRTTGRITKTKLSQFLFHRLLPLARGEITTAALITNTPHPLSRVRLYYATPSLERLQETYRRAMQDFLSPISPASMQQAAMTNVVRSAPELYVGSRFCPTVEAVQTAIQKLQELLRRLPPPDFLRYHNHYTLYSVWSFAFAVGIRGISTPFLGLDQIHRKTGLTTLADKDYSSGYKTRLAWIPPLAQEQMQHYEEHCQLIRRLYPQLQTWTEPCFFFKEDADRRSVHPEQVRPSTLAPHMQPFLPFPANVHRRFVRNELLNSQCSPQVVDA